MHIPRGREMSIWPHIDKRLTTLKKMSLIKVINYSGALSYDVLSQRRQANVICFIYNKTDNAPLGG